MAFDTIGLHSFINITGPMGRSGIESEDITRPYTNSVGIRHTRLSCPVTELIATRDTTTQAFCEAFYVSYMLTKGTVLDIVRRGITYADYYVWDVTEEGWSTGANAVGGVAGGHILFVTRFVVQYAGAIA